MKITQLLESTLKLAVDNPGGEWLQHKKKDYESVSRTKGGARSAFGTVTANFTRPALIPVDVAKSVRGINDEQSNVRDHSLAWLMKEMGEKNELPRIDGRQYAPFIMVDQDGEAYTNEGNHRIMAAAKLGWKYIPVTIRYFNGGEDVSGKFTPAKVKAWDSEAQAKGYKIGNEFKGKPQIAEAPLRDIEIHKGEGSSYSERDLNLIKHNIFKKRYHERLKNIPIDLYVYIIDDELLGSIAKTYPEQEIDVDTILYDMEKRFKSEFDTPVFRKVAQQIEDVVKKNKKSVHFIMGDNFANSEVKATGITPWMLVHRFFHAISTIRELNPLSTISNDIWLILSDAAAYHPSGKKISLVDRAKKIDHLQSKIFTFKSARDEAISDNELVPELFTQYLLSGEIKLADTTKSVLGEKTDELIKQLDKLKQLFDNVLKKLKGRAFYV